ncbi:MAG: tyrosinase family protein [Symploca sp. SIO1C4]|uniref:Tyrosinase family protein n=1 Tax=Symploca sp. SIO1C4 TaxID=2607765 RepID=A0A6B3N9A7_9CYAN|nr:tyrosinase family protein [Symploca sp. SIO1C4]
MSNVIQCPTWHDISKMITDDDVREMKNHGLDLRCYEQVSALAHKIYYYLGYKLMPPGRSWSDAQITTYNNWLINDMPKDAAHQAQIIDERNAALATADRRVRKDINQLDSTEKEKLKDAFQWLMDQDPKTEADYNPNALCYFSLAAKHWYPVPTFCQHHIYGYLPWHRWQMLDFEDALRSAPGCQDVTLPYWNIETGEFPQLISEPPFKDYTFPINVYPDYYDPPTDIGKQGTTTERNSSFQGSNVVNQCINNARTAPKFSQYNGITNYKYDSSSHIMRAHDRGHVGSGKTMANQDIAAFDPMFWFFHCNWDRLWWEWQSSRNATDLEGFKETLESCDDQKWLIDPQMSISDPFSKKNSDSIDITQLEITYTRPEETLEKVKDFPLPLAIGPSWRDQNDGQSTLSTFTIAKENLNRVSLRVKGVNRIKVPGSFWVVLYLGGEEVGRDAFFQSTFSGNCENCVAQAKVNFDFVFDRSHLTDVEGNPKEIKVEVISAITDEVMPFDAIGNPTINIRMLH